MIGTTVSHFRIIDKLGGGGMGVVYKAEDTKLHRTVALKFLPHEFSFDDEVKQRFLHEAQTASSLQHNNICNIHAIDETEDGQIFICMDYYEGETLKSKISKGLLNFDEVMNITTQISEGLCKAHEKGIIHRDIKPANIFITKEGIVKILDFGLAKKVDTTQFTGKGVKFGTTNYMSPEQIKGEKVDHRTDIWSLGVLLYEMLTGKPPFHADYEQTIVYLILNQEPEDVREYRQDVPEKLLSILEKSMAKYLNDRYDDLVAVLEDLETVTTKGEIEFSEFELPAPRTSHSIAVLPFVNLSTDPEQELFCDGLTEELISTLSRIRNLKVVARTSAYAFKGGSYDVRNVGKRLNVRTILEGSVRKSDGRLRITAQLINVLDGYHLWSERYDRELKDVFELQEEISLSIVDVLKIKLLENEKENLIKRYTDNIEAYNLCQQGNYFFNSFNFNLIGKSIEYFHNALEKDPNYTLAYLGLGKCYFSLSWFGVKSSSEILPYLKNYIYKMLEIDKNFGAGYSLLGLLKICYEWNQTEAESALSYGLELSPNDVDSLLFFSVNQTIVAGKFDLARKLAERAKNIDPLSDYTEAVVAFPDLGSGKYIKVVERLSKYLKSDLPYWWGLWTLWRALSLLNREDEAVEACKKSFLAIDMSIVVQAMEKVEINNAIEAAAYKMAEIFEHRYVSPYNIALLFVHAKKNEEALTWLEKSMELIDPKAPGMNKDPEWQSLRTNPRFQSCLKKIGLKA